MSPSIMNTNGGEDHHLSHRHHVEIATLSMPSAAAESGVQSGDGTNFILEAPTCIIDQLAETENHHHHEQQQQQHQPCIEGVVDLEAASHLVTGITEEEFVGLLHHEAAHAHQHDQFVTSSEVVERVDDEETLSAPTQGKDAEKGHKIRQSSAGKSFGSEDQPLLSQSSNNQSGNTTACLSLSADPFVNTLALHHQDRTKYTSGRNNEGRNNEEEGDDVTSVVTVGVTSGSEVSFRPSFLRGDHHVDIGATMSRDAFLLSVPTHGTRRSGRSGIGSSNYGGSNGNGADCLESDDAFVLALPEMIEQSREEENSEPVATSSGLVGSFLRTSVNLAGTVAGIAHEVDHAFAPLPTDVQNVDLRVSIVSVHTKSEGYQEEVHLDLVVDRQVPIIGYVILVSGLVALSSIGAALDLQQGGVSPEMKILWRLNSTSILFLLLAGRKMNRGEFARFTWKQLWIEMPFAAANYAVLNTTFAVSLEMTSLVNAFILSNMASLLMIGSKFALGAQVLFFEGLGAFIGFSGALICAAAGNDDDDMNKDRAPAESAEETSMSREMIGNIIAFTCSVSTAFYLTVAKRLRPQVDLVLFMFLIFTLASAFLLVYIMVYSGQDYEFSFDPVIGVFGWVNRQADRFLLEIYIAVICNGVGTMGYVAIMKYFDPVVVSMVMLMEPIIATFIGMAVGVSTLPGWVTWAGDAVVMVGSIMVIWSGSRKRGTIDATDALQKADEMEHMDAAKSPKLMKRPAKVTVE